MNDEHNEQLLWFVRRTIELEERLRKMTENFNERAAEAMRERELADDLAEQLRLIARLVPWVSEYSVTRRNFHAREEGDPPTVTNTGGRRIGDDDNAIVLIYPEGSIGYAKSPLEKWRAARSRRFGRPLEVIAAEPEPWP